MVKKIRLDFLGFPDHHVDENGEVYFEGEILKSGYDSAYKNRIINLKNGDKKRRFKINWLVYVCFIDTYSRSNRDLNIIHKDGNYNNCHYSNLELYRPKQKPLTEKQLDALAIVYGMVQPKLRGKFRESLSIDIFPYEAFLKKEYPKNRV